jgi:hypothetical protein
MHITKVMVGTLATSTHKKPHNITIIDKQKNAGPKP